MRGAGRIPQRKRHNSREVRLPSRRAPGNLFFILLPARHSQSNERLLVRFQKIDIDNHNPAADNLGEMAESLFTKIIEKKVPAKIAYEDQDYIAIHDINPQAPVHLLVIPKRPIATLNDLDESDGPLVGGMVLVARKLMAQMGQSDYRTVFNCGPRAGQSVFHIHLHVLAGRSMGWPPG